MRTREGDAMSVARDVALALADRRAQRLSDGAYLVPCPVPSHGKGLGDRNPSLRIGDGASRLLVHCYAGCDPRDVLDVLRRRGLLDDAPSRNPSAIKTPPPKPRNGDERRNIDLADRIWREATHIEGTPGALYFYKRNIDITLAPDFGRLRWHARCPWGKGGTTPCVVARFTDAITGEPRGIWRRPISGETPHALGPIAGCVIRLWPDAAVTTALVCGEGPETVLSAALHITRHGTLLQPAWAAGCADNVKNLPVLAGIECLTLLVDNDASGKGQRAAAEGARIWVAAGREVIRLTPRELGADFNDIIAGKQP
jgi:hypothetical protein